MAQMETLYSPTKKDLAISIDQLHERLSAFMSYDLNKKKSLNEMSANQESIAKLVAHLLVGIDELIELCAMKELGYKK